MKVFELLATPDKWIQGTGYADTHGNCTTINEAACWCLYVAIAICYKNWEDQYIANSKVRGRIGWESIVAWNDAPERTHAEVLALCKELDV